VATGASGNTGKDGVVMIGCELQAIEKGETANSSQEAMAEIGLECARSGYAYKSRMLNV
jgi:carbamoyl-phosphate synthase large subunit